MYKVKWSISIVMFIYVCISYILNMYVCIYISKYQSDRKKVKFKIFSRPENYLNGLRCHSFLKYHAIYKIVIFSL